MKLTRAKKKVLIYYEKFIREHGYMPTYKEASDELSIAPSVVYNHVKFLKEGDYISEDDEGVYVNKGGIYSKAARGTDKNIDNKKIKESDILSELMIFKNLLDAITKQDKVITELEAKVEFLMNLELSPPQGLFMKPKELYEQSKK